MSLPNLFFSIPITYITYVLKIKELAGKERARLTTLSKAGNDIKYTCHLILPGLLYCDNLWLEMEMAGWDEKWYEGSSKERSGSQESGPKTMNNKHQTLNGVNKYANV